MQPPPALRRDTRQSRSTDLIPPKRAMLQHLSLVDTVKVIAAYSVTCLIIVLFALLAREALLDILQLRGDRTEEEGVESPDTLPVYKIVDLITQGAV